VVVAHLTEQLPRGGGINSKQMIRTFKTYYEEEKQDESKRVLTVIPLFDESVVIAPPSFTFIFVLDESGSMGGTPWDDLCRAYNTFIQMRKREQTGSTEYVSIIQFDSSARKIVENCDIKHAPTSLSISGGGTSFDPALNMASGCIATSHGIPVLIFMSDGEGSYSGVMKNIYANYKSRGLQVHTIAFGRTASSMLQQIANDGCGKFHLAMNGIELGAKFASIASIQSPLQQLATLVGSKLCSEVANKIVLDYL